MRRTSREIALKALFQSEFSQALSAEHINQLEDETVDSTTLSYAQELIDGVTKYRVDIDEKISAASRHWKIERMGGVDRNVLRLAVFEMKFATEPIKQSIAINEAVELAKNFGSTDSGSFVNGILDQVAKGF